MEAWKGMWKNVDMWKVIKMKTEGKTNREISRKTGYDRAKISEVWSRYCGQISQLGEENVDIKAIQEEMFAKPEYKKREGGRRKYTAEVEEKLKEILEEEKRKSRRLGKDHKQKMTNLQIHEKLVAMGIDISRATINTELARLRKKQKEVFVKQLYDYGDRLEYDFGEVTLNCGEGYKTYHMAVFSSPGGKFKWTYLYTNQKQDVFLDSHVKFFKMIGGVWKEVVYDNMRNVVSKFIGRNEKELNKEFLKMANYYGFTPNVTNCFKGNEKGSVECAVKTTRNQIFALRDAFASIGEAREYMHSRLVQMNEGSEIEEEKLCLMPTKPPLEISTIYERTVDQYSFIQIDTVFYSVPEELVGKKVIVKKYHDEVRVFYNNALMCKHDRLFGEGKLQVDIYHYLETLRKKPGAIRNSAALKGIPKMKAIFDTHYADKPRKFIEVFIENKGLALKEMIALFEEKINNTLELNALDVVKPTLHEEIAVRSNMAIYTTLVNIGIHKAMATPGENSRKAAISHDEDSRISGNAQAVVC
jgi:transposase